MRSGISGGPGGSCQRLVMAGFRMCAGGLMYRPSGPFFRRFRLCSDSAWRQLLLGRRFTIGVLVGCRPHGSGGRTRTVQQYKARWSKHLAARSSEILLQCCRRESERYNS